MGKGKSFLKWMKGRMMGRYHIWDISGGRESESERKYDESESEFVKGRMMGRYIRKERKWKWERMLGIYIRPQGKWKWEKIWWKWEGMCERENDGQIYQEAGKVRENMMKVRVSLWKGEWWADISGKKESESERECWVSISGRRESESERKYDESESEYVKGRMMGRYIRREGRSINLCNQRNLDAQEYISTKQQYKRVVFTWDILI